MSCPAGHSFDKARSGYINLLQPQDRHAREPGDSALAVAARRRTFDRGLLAHVSLALVAEATACALLPGAAVLDVGCGEGGHIGALGARLPVDAWGVELSKAGAEAAARRYPQIHFVVANADRRLPFRDGAFALVTSITGPKNAEELRRLLAPGGRFILGASAADDLTELRAAVFGAAHDLDRRERMLEIFGGCFTLERERVVRNTVTLDRAALLDLAATTYRGGRQREHERLSAMTELAVTLSLRLMVFAPR